MSSDLLSQAKTLRQWIDDAPKLLPMDDNSDNWESWSEERTEYDDQKLIRVEVAHELLGKVQSKLDGANKLAEKYNDLVDKYENLEGVLAQTRQLILEKCKKCYHFGACDNCLYHKLLGVLDKNDRLWQWREKAHPKNEACLAVLRMEKKEKVQSKNEVKNDENSSN
jgi:hypothetical protein